MKKSNYAALVFGAISVLMLGLGMSMALLPEWNMFTPGVVIGVAGLIVALVGVFVWRSMENKQPIQWNSKAIMTIMVGVLGAFALGLGMCFIMLWGNIMLGIIIGVIGLVVFLGLIPMAKGLR